MTRYFITGTDTGVGKTYISQGLLNLFKMQGYSTCAIKPIASGCEIVNGKLYNQDALILQQASTIKLPYEAVNPFRFASPVAPHLAAEAEKQCLTIDSIINRCQTALLAPAQVCVIEGAGGWFVPINQDQLLADLPFALNAKVILVVGMRLGCINHALLTYAAIQQKTCDFVGWVANCLEKDMPYLNENITTLRAKINAPLWGIVPYQAVPEHYLEFCQT